jgi:hypothetical protein
MLMKPDNHNQSGNVEKPTSLAIDLMDLLRSSHSHSYLWRSEHAIRRGLF